MPQRACEPASASSSRERPVPRKEPVGRGSDPMHPPPYTVWGACGRSASRQRPLNRVDLKRPNKPPAAASLGRSRYAYQEKKSLPALLDCDGLLKRICPSLICSSPSTAPSSPLGAVSRSADHFPSSSTVEGTRHLRFSPHRVAAGCRHCACGKGHPALSPMSVFPALAFMASLGHASMHEDAVSSPLLLPDA